jgi:hypothetical protein
MNAFRCDHCSRVYDETEIVTIRAKTTSGKLVEYHWCPMSKCDEEVTPFHIESDRRRGERRAA